jgi:hypothetical protein
MHSSKLTIEQYLEMIPEDRREAISNLRQLVLANLPNGFVESINQSGINYTVPHSLYPKGYHCDPNQALLFLSVASQKNFIAVYHMGIYAQPDLLNWFTEEYPKHNKTKLDMGKSCIRFKKPDQIPFVLLAELCSKITPQHWIEIYEEHVRR